MHRIRNAVTDIRSSLWFVPGTLVLAAIVMAIVMIEIDIAFEPEIRGKEQRLFLAGPEGARGVLEAIAQSMVTVAGVVFSITIVALSLASSQYTPRVLRTFMRDRGNQAVLGVFLGIFAYCLVVMRTIRSGDDEFVPSVAVVVAVALALVGIGFLIYFIHHIALSIQASHILATIQRETITAVDRLFPEGLGAEADEEHVAPDLDGARWTAVPSRTTGYIQRLETDALVEFAAEHDVVVRMERGIGEFVIEGTPLVSLSGAGAEGQDEAQARERADALNALYRVNQQRTVEQDAGFGIRQMVDVALKALSPSTNDATTAVMSLQYLGAVLVRLARRRIEHPLRETHGRLRVIARGPSFERLVDEALDQVRQSAEGHPAVLHRMLWVLDTVGRETDDRNRRRTLRRHVDAVREAASRTVQAPHDRAGLEPGGFQAPPGTVSALPSGRS
jgi:uncharacterized membrane protein